mmetsp:Transcript_78033/g.187092  ORF Transcript_78033/g.187092 Transcript_78033/m.187092 type:complete len:300 (-) Transcript_78033:951-1850(-)
MQLVFQSGAFPLLHLPSPDLDLLLVAVSLAELPVRLGQQPGQQTVQERVDLGRLGEGRGAGEQRHAPGLLQQGAQRLGPLGGRRLQVVGLVANHQAVRRTPWGLAETRVLRHEVVAHHHHPRLGPQRLSALADHLHVALRVRQQVVRQPAGSFFPPIPPQGGGTHHEHWKVQWKLCCQSQRLCSLPQAHLVAQQHPPAPAQCKVHCFPLVRQHLAPLAALRIRRQKRRLEVRQQHVRHLLGDLNSPVLAELGQSRQHPVGRRLQLVRSAELPEPLQNLAVLAAVELELLRLVLGTWQGL